MISNDIELIRYIQLKGLSLRFRFRGGYLAYASMRDGKVIGLFLIDRPSKHIMFMPIDLFKSLKSLPNCKSNIYLDNSYLEVNYKSDYHIMLSDRRHSLTSFVFDLVEVDWLLHNINLLETGLLY